MNSPLTTRQQAVLDAVGRLIRVRSRVPTILELADELGVSGPTVHQHLKALEHKGYVHRKAGSPRSLEVIGAAPESPCDCTRVPVVGEVAGGAPIFAFEQLARVGGPAPNMHRRMSHNVCYITHRPTCGPMSAG